MIRNRLRNKNQKYDAWLHWNITHRSNLNCLWCCSKNPLKKTAEIHKINIPALIKTVNKTNKTFKISFTGGGEPFLIPNIIEACVELTRNHFIRLVTNLTSVKLKEFAEKIDPERVIQIIASLHIKELERLNLLDKYIYNFRLCKEKGFNIKAFEVAHPQLLDEIDKYKKFFYEKGIQLEFKSFFGEYNGKIYPNSYTEKEIRNFGLSMKEINVNRQKGNFCNAGYNIGVINPNGDLTFCNQIRKPMGNIYDKIKFNNKIVRCPFEFCGCPLNILDTYLLKKAIKETNLKIMNPIFLKMYVLKEYLVKVLSIYLPLNMRNQIKYFLKKLNLARFDY